MAKAKNENFTGEILHFGSVRMRVTGSGTLRSSLISLDDVNTSNLPNLSMATTTNKEPLLLANMSEQRAYLRVKTTGINEYFNISKITIYVRPIFTGYPQ